VYVYSHATITLSPLKQTHAPPRIIEGHVETEREHTARWPEHMDFDELMERREKRGAKVFNQEYLCSPVYTEDAWLEEADVLAAVNLALPNRSVFTKYTDLIGDITACFDIGKKRHPSHLVIFETRRGRILHGLLLTETW